MNVLPLARRAEVFSHLMEGVGVRAASRLTGVSQPTILKLLLDIGAGYDRVHDRLVRDLSVEHIEADELHSYVGKREKNLPEVHAPEIGEPRAVGLAFTGPACGAGVDYAQIVKSFGNGRRSYAKVVRKPGSPPLVAKRVIWGAPDLKTCGTSRAERLNLSFRTQLRRLVRRGSGFSKKLGHHRACISAYVGFFNFCRIHMALRVTPAMQVGIADRVWSAEEFVQACLSEPEGAPPSPQPLQPRPGAQGATRQTSTGVWLRAVPKQGSAPAAPPAGKRPAIVKAAAPPAPAPGVSPPANKVVLASNTPMQGDLFAWAATRPAVPPPVPLPLLGIQLPLFPDR